MSGPTPKALADALKWLSRKDRFATEIAEYLAARGYLNDDVSETLNYVQSKGLQSDRRTAEAWQRHFESKGFSPAWIAERLQALGCPMDLVGSGSDTGTQSLRQLAAEQLQKGQSPAKAARFLISRGHDPDEVAMVVGELSEP